MSREIWRRWASTLLDMGVRIVARFHSTPAAPRTAAGVGDGRKGESAMAVKMLQGSEPVEIILYIIV